MRLNQLSVITIMLLLTGCYSTVARVASIGMDKSKYRPILITTSDVNAWEATAKETNRQVVKDELGTYYFDVKPEGIYQAYIAAKDGETLRNMFSGEVGLVEPVYIQDDDLNIRPDWKETERRHDYLTRTIKLKLLPLSATRKYHELVEQKARAAGGEVSISQALRANIGLYDSTYYSSVIQKVPGKFSYFVASAFGAGSYYFGIQNQINVQRAELSEAANRDMQRRNARSSKIDPNQSPMAFRGAARSIGSGYTLHFGLVETFKEIQGGGMNYLAVSSSCGFSSPDELRKRIQETSDATNVPYASGISMAMKERDPEELRSAKAEFFKARSEAVTTMRRHEVACLGVREMGISGRIGSQKLD